MDPVYIAECLGGLISTGTSDGTDGYTIWVTSLSRGIKVRLELDEERSELSLYQESMKTRIFDALNATVSLANTQSIVVYDTQGEVLFVAEHAEVRVSALATYRVTVS